MAETIFTSPGTWTNPGFTKYIDVTIVSGGGGGLFFSFAPPQSSGLLPAPTGGYRQGGGGGGGVLTSLINVNSYPVSVVVGAGGSGGTAPGAQPPTSGSVFAGSAGGLSSITVNSPAPSTYTVEGGGGGGNGTAIPTAGGSSGSHNPNASGNFTITVGYGMEACGTPNYPNTGISAPIRFNSGGGMWANDPDPTTNMTIPAPADPFNIRTYGWGGGTPQAGVGIASPGVSPVQSAAANTGGGGSNAWALKDGTPRTAGSGGSGAVIIRWYE